MSRQMLIGYLTLIIAILALPQFLAIIPPEAIAYVACGSGLLTLFLRWLGGGLGANTLTAAGITTLVVGLLGVPELLALIPANVMPFVMAVTAILTLVSRVQAGNDATDPAAQVNLLFRR